MSGCIVAFGIFFLIIFIETNFIGYLILFSIIIFIGIKIDNFEKKQNELEEAKEHNLVITIEKK